jgi:hypothetical protein
MIKDVVRYNFFDEIYYQSWGCVCQVIESKRKDANSSSDYSSSDAVRVSVLVCNLSTFCCIEDNTLNYIGSGFSNFYMPFCAVWK